MDMFRSELMASNIDPKDIFYINIEEDDQRSARSHMALTDLVRSKIEVGKGKYLFFDDIQNVDGWE